MAEQFFNEKRGAAVLKHGILRRYLEVFARKTGSTAPDGRVVFLDGYAGPGTYSDGSEGSPTLAVATADSVSSCRELHGIYVEKKASACAELDNLLAASTGTHTVLQGEIEEKLDDALELAGADAPMFAFFDPFGLLLGMERIHEVLARSKVTGGRRNGPATEVMINFMYSAIRRVAGHLTAEGSDPTYLAARKTMLARLDRVLDGDWWRQAWIDSEGQAAEERCALIARGYLDRFTRRLGGSWGWYRVPVRKRPSGPVAYELLFVTLYPREGLWHFNEIVSSAEGDYRAFARRGELQLDEEQIIDKLLVHEIKANIARLLTEKDSFIIYDEMKTVLDTTAGRGREKHIRRAIKELYKNGLTSSDGKGKLRDYRVRRA